MCASWRGKACCVASSACSSRSPSSYQWPRSRRVVSWLMRAASRPRGDDAVSAATASGPARRSSRWRSRRATMVDGCSATVANEPGASVRTRRIARSTTAVDTGERPSATRGGDPISSASRYSVSMSTAATPPSRPSARRAMTPAVLVGTITVTGARGSPALARWTAPASASRARPGARASTLIGTYPIVEKGCAHRALNRCSGGGLGSRARSVATA